MLGKWQEEWEFGCLLVVRSDNNLLENVRITLRVKKKKKSLVNIFLSSGGTDECNMTLDSRRASSRKNSGDRVGLCCLGQTSQLFGHHC